MITRLTRRAFLRLTAGGSLAFAAGGLGNQFPANWISEPLPSEKHIKPVDLLRYATTCRECPAGCGMHVRQVNGRAIKAEGNPDHPVNRGGLCGRGQSALQGLYDSDRLTEPLQRSRPAGGFPDNVTQRTTWGEALRGIGRHLRKNKGRTFVISSLETGPLADIMRQFAGNFNGELLLFEPFNYQPLREVNQAVIGRPVIPWYALDKCEVIVSFGADFLESWVSNIQYAEMFSRMHMYRETGRMGRFAYTGPRLSMTAANADDFLMVPPGFEYDVAMNILKVMVARGWINNRDGIDYRNLTRDFNPEALPLREAGRRIEQLAADFAHAEAAVALPGPAAARGNESRQLAEGVFLLNQASGNIGRTVDFSRVHALSETSYEEDLVQVLKGLTKNDVVILHQVNPVYVRPGLEDMIREAGLVVSLSQLPDETTLLADWVLPVDNPLESWGEYSPWTGMRTLLQPTMQRLYNSRAAGDIFLSLSDIAGRPLARNGDAAADLDFASWLRAGWQDEVAKKDEDPRRFLSHMLRAGIVRRDGTGQVEPPAPQVGGIKPAPPHSVREGPADRANLWLWPSIFFFDGRTANRSWLQENPQPDSYIAWGSWVDIHPVKAAALGVRDGDGLRITSGGNSVEVPVRITDEIEKSTVGLALGQGHRALGSIAAGRGVNGFALLNNSLDDTVFVSVTIARIKAAGKPICLAASRDQHERELLRWEKLSSLREGTGVRSHVNLPMPEGFRKEYDIYMGHEHAEHRWAMVIDLHRCIGCGACAVACYAENNIPTVGPRPVAEGRDMAWLKVIPYAHPDKKKRLGFLPLPCQHCDQAPCEPVCPVFASVHNEEGLNAQIYNRCIGTRYCSQNCPYKVRRFNWLNPTWTPPLEWQLNPEVTVRSRGVMEKCTFCVQRIRHAEYRAKLEDRPLKDGEVQPACVQSCPAKVFTFGDLHDRDSAVYAMFRDDARGYQLLHELNTKPAVLYLKKIDMD